MADDVQITIKAFHREGRYELDRAFPVGGSGVTINTKDGKQDRGLSKPKKWREGESRK